MLKQGALSPFFCKMSWLVGGVQLRRDNGKFYEQSGCYDQFLTLKKCGLEFYRGTTSLFFTPLKALVYLSCLLKSGLNPSHDNFARAVGCICNYGSDQINANQEACSHSSGTKVLVVDDNQMNQKIAALLLEKAGYKFTVVSNGLEALNLIKGGQNFGAILMDCNMPIMDGLTSTSHIRQWELQNGLDKTPIVALTGSVDPEEVKSCYDAGMDAYLPKPYRAEQLIRLLSEFDLTA